MKRLIFCIIYCLPLFADAQDAKLPAVAVPRFKKDTLSISKFGAVADGLSLNTKSINDAITACSNKGGGVM
jgi:DNA sulfur modification protein DndE